MWSCPPNCRARDHDDCDDGSCDTAGRSRTPVVGRSVVDPVGRGHRRGRRPHEWAHLRGRRRGPHPPTGVRPLPLGADVASRRRRRRRRDGSRLGRSADPGASAPIRRRSAGSTTSSRTSRCSPGGGTSCAPVTCGTRTPRPHGSSSAPASRSTRCSRPTADGHPAGTPASPRRGDAVRRRHRPTPEPPSILRAGAPIDPRRFTSVPPPFGSNRRRARRSARRLRAVRRGARRPVCRPAAAAAADRCGS